MNTQTNLALVVRDPVTDPRAGDYVQIIRVFTDKPDPLPVTVVDVTERGVNWTREGCGCNCGGEPGFVHHTPWLTWQKREMHLICGGAP